MSDFGKFNSAEELLKGYAELEKSFTQKCQQLSAMEKQLSSLQSATQAVPAETSESSTGEGSATAGGTSGLSDQQPSPPATSEEAGATVPTRAKDAPNGSPASSAVVPPTVIVMSGGGNVSAAMPNRPKTLKEASELAKKFFE